MPTVFTHAAIPLALGLGLGRRAIPVGLLVAGVAAAMLPDIDGLGTHIGIPFRDALFGHRGLTHSLAASVAVATCIGLIAPILGARRWIAWLFSLVAMVSHGLLDMLTNGGPGVALFWPWSLQRFFLPWQVIKVSPMTAGELVSQRGVEVMFSELAWVWLPCILVMFFLVAVRGGLSVRYGSGGDVR